jgi:hypothetical protein
LRSCGPNHVRNMCVCVCVCACVSFTNTHDVGMKLHCICVQSWGPKHNHNIHISTVCHLRANLGSQINVHWHTYNEFACEAMYTYHVHVCMYTYHEHVCMRVFCIHTTNSRARLCIHTMYMYVCMYLYRVQNLYACMYACIYIRMHVFV